LCVCVNCLTAGPASCFLSPLHPVYKCFILKAAGVLENFPDLLKYKIFLVVWRSSPVSVMLQCPHLLVLSVEYKLFHEPLIL
jgi:hypothetical protein